MNKFSRILLLLIAVANLLAIQQVRAVTPVPMATKVGCSYTENFTDITNWTNGFASGIGASAFSGVASTGAATGLPDATKTTTATNISFTTSTTGGVQKAGSTAIALLSTGATDNTTSAAIDMFFDFSGTNAGNLTFNWQEINNSTGNRCGSLIVYASTDGTTWTQVGTTITVTNNVASNGAFSAALPASFNGSATARLRFYYFNGNGTGSGCGSTGSRPKIGFDDITVTATTAVTISGTNTICSGGSTTLTAAAPTGATYLWSTTATTAAINPSPTTTTTYTVTVNDSGCSSTSAVTVIVNTPVISDDIDDQRCSGTSSAIDLSSDVSGTTVTWTAALTSGNAIGFSNSTAPLAVTDVNTLGDIDIAQTLTNNSITTPAIVTYTITPTAGGCPGAPYDVALTIYPALDITFVPTCSNGTTYDINFTISGGSGADYYATYADGLSFIDNFDGTGTITGIPVATTSVTLDIEDGNFCQYSETYTLVAPTQPTLSLTPGCGGGAGTGIITPSFTAGAGGTPTYNPSVLTGLANGDYTVTVTESGSGCTATASATINCSGGTTVTGSADGTDPCFCLTAPTLDANNVVLTDGTFGDEMVITTSGPSNPNLVWEVSVSTATTPIVGANFINNNDGTYHIAITYPAGAGGTAGTWSITATETSGSGLPNITVSGGSLCAYTVGTLADITTPVCSTAPITLTATPTGGTFGGAGTGGTYTPAPTGSAQGPLAYSYTYDAHPAVGSNPACPLTLNADISVPACVATTCGAVAAAPIGTITPTTFCRTGGALLGSDAEDATPLTDFNLYDRLYLLVDNATGIIVSNATTTADLIAPDNTTTTPIVYSVYSLVYDIAQGVAITDGTSTITLGNANVIKDTGGDALQASPTVAACMDLSPAASTTVTVNPKPELGDDLDDATCSGASAAIDLYANVSGLPANPWTGLTVTWTAALTSGSATGFNNQTTPVTVDNNPDTFEITDVLINPSTTTPAVVTYTITPTPNANGCSGDTYVVALTVYPTLDIDFAPICSVDGTTYDLNFTISGGSGADYAATYATDGLVSLPFTDNFDGTGTITNIPIATTSVTLEVADGNIGGASSDNCSYSETYTFTPPALSLAPSCVSGTGTITPTFTAGAGGTPTYNPATLTGLANGNYTVTVTESGSGCTATSSATINCSPLCPTLTVAAPVAVVTSESTCTSCNLIGGVIDVPATSCPAGSTLQYSTDNGTSWSTTLPTYNQTTAITVLTRCNCDVDNNVSSPTSSVTTAPGTCTPISAGLTNNGPICSGSTATFTATPAGATTYAWSAGGSTTDVTTTAALTADATYTVTVTAANGCSSVASSTVTVNTTTAGLTNNGPICSGSTATFTATPAGATTYAWSAGGSTTDVTTTAALTADATYTVTVTANGCSSTASSTVTVNATPNFTGTASCSGVAGTGSVSQTATGGTAPYTYAITGGSFGATLADGNYTVTVTDNNSCSTTSTVLVNCSGALIAVGNADATDPCYCITPPTLDANNVVLTTGTFGDEMIITTSPANSTLVWEVLTTTASTPIVGTNFTNNNDGTYTLNITYPAGAGGSAGSWSITATEKTGTNLPNITVSGGSGCSYVIGSLADVVAPACSAATITLTGTPSGGTWGSVATPAGTYSPTPSTVAQGPFQYTYTYDAHPAVGIHPACPLTLKADITIPACAPTCTPSAGTW